MLRSVNDLIGYNVVAQDGECGQVKDVLFDDVDWTIRYLVVDTGDWLAGRKVLIPTGVLRRPNWSGSFFPIDLNRDRIESMPPLSWDEPVGRRHEKELMQHLNIQPYWVRGPLEHPVPLVETDYSTRVEEKQQVESEDSGDPHLRSCEEVIGYHIKASDGEIGHAEDFLADDELWTMRYCVVDTRNWLPGRKVLVAVLWFNKVNWERAWLSTDLDREQIEKSPEYDPITPLSRNYEGILHDHYGRAKYWP